jgi:murein L,D-transpeptidase YafK
LPDLKILLCAIVMFCGLWHAYPPALHASPEDTMPMSYVSIGAYHRAYDRLLERLEMTELELGSPLFIRIFKDSKELEAWLLGANGRYELFKSYSICDHSGELGPKLEAGDKQSPEGFYRVGADQMNPWSKYHLSFNLGYPNEFDQAHDRTGAALMVHGRCSSQGCFAMTDYYMDEIYTLADAALSGGQAEFQVHIFPFRLTTENIQSRRSSRWFDFWLNLKQGFDIFEKKRIPPRVEVVDGTYVFSNDHSGSIVQHSIKPAQR